MNNNNVLDASKTDLYRLMYELRKECTRLDQKYKNGRIYDLMVDIDKDLESAIEKIDEIWTLDIFD